MININEISNIIHTIGRRHLNVRTITIGISLLDCADPDSKAACQKICGKITRQTEYLVAADEVIERKFGIPIVSKCISITPMTLVTGISETGNYVPFAVTMDNAAKSIGISFIGGFSALVQKGATRADKRLIVPILEALTITGFACPSASVGSTRARIDTGTVIGMGRIIKDTTERIADRGGFGCAKLVVFCNVVEGNPFMADAFRDVGEPDCIINMSMSDPDVAHHVLKDAKGQPFDVIAETIKKAAFWVTRVGQLVAQEASHRLGVSFGTVDLSLAPIPTIGDSVARILEEMGLKTRDTHGITAALALLNGAVKKGGVMTPSHVGGLSGAFTPVSEDKGMTAAIRSDVLHLDKLKTITCVCSVGLDMIAVPGDTTAATLSAIITDEAATGMVSSKTTAVRLIPTPGEVVGNAVEFDGLLGSAPVMSVHAESSNAFMARGERIPTLMQSLKN